MYISFVPETKNINLPKLFLYLISIHFHYGQSNIFNTMDDVQKFTIEENQPVKTFVGRVRFNRQFEEKFTYSLSERSNWFVINPSSGDILTLQVIDLEAICPNVCQDNDYGSVLLSVNIRKHKDLVTMVKVSVLILDVDDNKPQFEQSEFSMDIKEVIHRKNMVIILPAAIDKDILLKNREITYKLTGDHSAFILEDNNNRGPKLRLLVDMDYEKQKEYKFTLSAHQKMNEEPSSNLSVTLKVININDCAPEFVKSLHEASIHEDFSLDEIIIKVEAFDADGDKLRYILIPNSNSFQINDVGEIRLLRKLDYETSQSYSFTIQATDGEFYSESKLKLSILDVNDEPPSYILNPSKLGIDETNKSGILVGQITIFDRDSISVNRGIKCTESNSEFQALRLELDRMSTNKLLVYKLYTMNPLDRETIPDGRVYTNLICYDCGIKRQLHTNITIILHVYDMNDNAPTFASNQYQVEVRENNEIGYQIFQAHATDEDIGKNAHITYTIQPSIDSGICIIDPQSGWIKLMQSLDREKKNQFLITVIATDQAMQDRKSGSTKLLVIVLDENDNAPELKDIYDLTIMENQPLGQYIGTLIAFDKDEGENARITFKIGSENAFSPITINQTGSLFSNQVFDREKRNKVCTQIILSDSAVRNVLSTKVPVCINILDENDNYPQILLFERDELTPIKSLFNKTYNEYYNVDYVLTISIREDVGFVLATVKANDHDSSNISNLSYYLESVTLESFHQPIFEIDVKSGRLSVFRKLHRDLLGWHKIKVMVEDSGQPPLRSAKNIIVEILDIPKFSSRIVSTDSTVWMPTLIGNNFMTSLVLSIVSALLILILICVILCIVKPCTNRSRFRNQTYEANYIPSLMFQDQVRHLSPDLGEKPQFEITGNMDGTWGGNTIKKQNLLSNAEQNWNNQRSFGPSNDIYLENIQKIPHTGEYNSPSQYVTAYNSQNPLRLAIRNDEQRSDSGKGTSDDDMTYAPRYICDPNTLSRNGYSTYSTSNNMQILPFPGCVFNCSSTSCIPVSNALHQSTSNPTYVTDIYPSVASHASTHI